MCVACHPHEVAVLAGGTFAGTIVLYELLNVILEGLVLLWGKFKYCMLCYR